MTGNAVFRGGGWFYDASGCRVADRYRYTPSFTSSYVGFRVVLAPPVQ